MRAPTLACPSGHPLTDPDSRFCSHCGSTLVPAAACAVHPDRAAGPCPRCGTFACAECLQDVPGSGPLCPACTARVGEGIAWDRREELGTLRAFWQTCVAMMLRPQVTLASAPPSASMGSSMWFITLATLAAFSSTLLLYAAIGGIAALAAAMGGESETRTSGLAIAGIVAAVIVIMAVAMVAMGVVGTLFIAALEHLVLRLVGARPSGFGVTFRATALSQAPALVGLIPFCGFYAYPVWAIVLRVFAYRQFHQTTTGKAVLGAVAVPVVLFTVFMLAYVAMLAFAMSAGAPAAGG